MKHSPLYGFSQQKRTAREKGDRHRHRDRHHNRHRGWKKHHTSFCQIFSFSHFFFFFMLSKKTLPSCWHMFALLCTATVFANRQSRSLDKIVIYSLPVSLSRSPLLAILSQTYNFLHPHMFTYTPESLVSHCTPHPPTHLILSYPSSSPFCHPCIFFKQKYKTKLSRQFTIWFSRCSYITILYRRCICAAFHSCAYWDIAPPCANLNWNVHKVFLQHVGFFFCMFFPPFWALQRVLFHRFLNKMQLHRYPE